MEAYRKFVVFIIFVTIIAILEIFFLKRWRIVRGIRTMDYHLESKHVTQNNSTLSLQRGEYKTSKFNKGSLMLYSALATNSSEKATWDIIVAQGWIEEKKTLSFGCCVIHNSGHIASYKGTSTRKWGGFYRPNVKYGAIHFQCHIGGNHNSFGAPSRVAIYPIGGVVVQKCEKDKPHFVDINLAYRQSGIAVFVKILFGQLNYLDLLAWFEIHRLLGVKKVLGYVTDDLNEKARVVLGHYQRTGLFEALHYPLETKSKESLLAVDINDPKTWTYRGVSVYDGQIRLGGYEYLISFDADEYLIPANRKESLRDVFDRLFGKQRNAAGFTFKTYFFIKNWGGEGNSSYSVEKYLNRSKEIRDCVKHVVIPNRVKLGDLRVHDFDTAAGYKRYEANTTDLSIYHYRSCRQYWEEETPGYCLKMNRFKDTRVIDLFQVVKPDIERIKEMYGLSLHKLALRF